MREYKFIKDELIKRHKIIDNQEYLDRYINTLINYKLKENVEYSESHHILPRSTFPEYENEEWNIIELDYEDHKLAHLWIFKAINIRKYQRPLNWMMSFYKNSEEISNSSKRGWEKLKKNKEKYDGWLESRSKHMKKLSSDEQRRRSNIFWENITTEEYNSFCENMRNYWTTEKRLEKSKSMKKFYLKEGKIDEKRIETQKRWDIMSEEDRIKFSEKMSIVNSDKGKREDAGRKIKEKWSDPIYLEKMKNRKHKKVDKIKIIYDDGTHEILNSMISVTRKYNFSAHLIRKYRDKEITICERDLNERNKILLNSKIETINI